MHPQATPTPMCCTPARPAARARPAATSVLTHSRDLWFPRCPRHCASLIRAAPQPKAAQKQPGEASPHPQPRPALPEHQCVQAARLQCSPLALPDVVPRSPLPCLSVCAYVRASENVVYTAAPLRRAGSQHRGPQQASGKRATKLLPGARSPRLCVRVPMSGLGCWTAVLLT